MNNVNNLAVFETSKYSPEQLLISTLKEADQAECMAVVWKRKDSDKWHTCIAGEMTAGNLMISSELLRIRAMEALE